MSLPRPTKQYATQGARRDVQEQVEVRGESVVSGDEGRMKIRHMVPCSTSNSPKPSTSASSTSESPKSMIGTLAFERQPLQTMSLKNRTTGKLAEAELGPTRATLDQKKGESGSRSLQRGRNSKHFKRKVKIYMQVLVGCLKSCLRTCRIMPDILCFLLSNLVRS